MLNTQENRVPIFLFGASGHAKVVIDIVEKQGVYQVAFLVDDDPALRGKRLYGYEVIGDREELRHNAADSKIAKGIVTIGSNRARRAVAEWLTHQGFGFVTAVHPGAAIARGASIGEGTVVMAGCAVNSDAAVGRHSIVNTGATIDHDCTIGSFVHVAPGAHLCGTVVVGDNSFICAGATVIPNLTIGREVLVGAGATVVNHLPDGVLVVGTPAQALKR